ncbi:hypothetical protein [Mucilaginibacter sp.]|uniref:hypothetical protein n=1 Tax=Mucilaginibacter sp. TaxID=1882438 RepID=UPI003D09C3A0
MMTDAEFREEYKPLQVPAHYDTADSQLHKMIFALAQIGEGTATQVIAALEKLEPGFGTDQSRSFVKVTLDDLFKKGHLTGAEHDGLMHYNLSKITRPNGGAINPDLLAPGLD